MDANLSKVADDVKARIDNMVGGKPVSIQQVDELRAGLQQLIDAQSAGRFRAVEAKPEEISQSG